MSIKVTLVSPFTFIITIMLVIYIGAIGFKSFFRYNNFKKEYLSTLSFYYEEVKRNKALKQEYFGLKNNQNLELYIRKNLFYIKPGETVYKIGSYHKEPVAK